jgi:hypothetical protein
MAPRLPFFSSAGQGYKLPVRRSRFGYKAGKQSPHAAALHAAWGFYGGTAAPFIPCPEGRRAAADSLGNRHAAAQEKAPQCLSGIAGPI